MMAVGFSVGATVRLGPLLAQPKDSNGAIGAQWPESAVLGIVRRKVVSWDDGSLFFGRGAGNEKSPHLMHTIRRSQSRELYDALCDLLLPGLHIRSREKRRWVRPECRASSANR
jgi:hypothetical protein